MGYLLQIVHIINQLIYKLELIRDFIKENWLSIIAIKKKIFNFINDEAITDIELINRILNQKQLRY